jgi:ATP synthase protein I
MRSFLWTQVIFIMLGALFAYVYLGWFDVMSLLYGGGVALGSSVILLYRSGRIIDAVAKGSVHATTLLYVGLVQRYLFVLLALGGGLLYLKLNAKPMLGMFAITQLVYFMPWVGRETEKSMN